MASTVTRISTHVLDTARGVPANDVSVHLERHENPAEWRLVASARTDDDGRCNQLLPDGETLARRASTGWLLIRQVTLRRRKVEGFYPVVQITFAVRDGETHFHIPLLLSP